MRRSFIQQFYCCPGFKQNRCSYQQVEDLCQVAKKQTTCMHLFDKQLSPKPSCLLCMLRSIFEYLRRQHLESHMSDTQCMKNIVDLSPTFLGEDEDGNIESIRRVAG